MAEIADRITLKDPNDLIPYLNNAKKHPQEQVEAIASSIKNYGWDQPIVVDGEGEVIKGHGRLQAAKLLDLERVPVIERDDLTEAEVRAARIADNKTAESGWLEDLLENEVRYLNEEGTIDMGSLGFDNEELGEMLAEDDDLSIEDKYTEKIKAPVYEPTGRKPEVSELYYRSKYDDLLDLVNDADLTPEQHEFFTLAAQRHVVFDYENIAEYYAHADPEVQALMEALTMIIIDFEQAVEQGFVTFAENVIEADTDA
jgi:hypothetical protein